MTTTLTALGCIATISVIIYFCWGDDHGRDL
jgi:hypothetical protein